MEPLELEPDYTTGGIPGRCIKCLAEEKLNSCLRMLLVGEGDDTELQQEYEMLVAFLQSADSRKLRVETEKYLAQGKKVTLKLCDNNGKPEYKLEVE